MSKADRSAHRHSDPSPAPAEQSSSFHKAFPTVSVSEKLVESYACGVKKIKKKASSVIPPVVKMGRLYVTARHCCFESPLMKTSMCVLWDDVQSVEKKSLVFYDEIHIVVRNGPGPEDHTLYCLTAFVSGSTAGVFDMLSTLWTVRSKYGTAGSDDSAASKATTAGAPKAATATAAASPPVPPVEVSPPQHAIVVTPQAGPASSPAASARVVSDSDTTDEDGSDPPSPGTPTPDTPTPAAPEAAAVEGRLTSPQRRRRKHSHAIARHFPSVPSEETVIDHFQCAYVQAVHRVGRLYITSHYVLFHSPFLSDSLVLPFADIATVEKATTLVLLGGITITLHRGPLARAEFTSFVHRDAAFNIIQHFFSAQRGKEALEPEPTAAAAASGAASPAPGDAAPFLTKTSSPTPSASGTAASLEELTDQVGTDFGGAMSSLGVFSKEVFAETPLPPGATLAMCFRCLFDDDHDFTKEYHTQRGDTDIAIEPWRPLTGSAAGTAFGGQRTLTCVTTVKAVFTGKYKFIQHQRYAFATVAGVPHLIVHFSGRVPDVTYGDAFHAEALLLLRARSSGVSMTVLGHVQFVKSVWVKGKITSTALDTEMPQEYRRMHTMASERLRSALAAVRSANSADGTAARGSDADAPNAKGGAVAPHTAGRSSRPVEAPSQQRSGATRSSGAVALVGLVCTLLGVLRLLTVPSSEDAPTIDALVRPLLAAVYCGAIVGWLALLGRLGLPLP